MSKQRRFAKMTKTEWQRENNSGEHNHREISTITLRVPRKIKRKKSATKKRKKNGSKKKRRKKTGHAMEYDATCNFSVLRNGSSVARAMDAQRTNGIKKKKKKKKQGGGKIRNYPPLRERLEEDEK